MREPLRTTEILLIRHGPTPWNDARRYQGWTDMPLAPAGRKAMAQLARLLAPLKPQVLYASPLVRARESAAILGRTLGLRPRTDARLKEIRFGKWEGKTAAELAAARDPAFQAWVRGKWVRPTGGESFAHLNRRTKAFLLECLRKHAGRRIAVVTHGGPIRTMIAQALGLTRSQLFRFRMHPASYTHLLIYPPAPAPPGSEARLNFGRRGVLLTFNVQASAARPGRS